MTPIFPIVELVDRLVIAQIKIEKTGLGQEEFKWYNDQMAKFDLHSIQDELAKLKEIHEQIWNLESELKSGVEHKLSLEEIGRRAIAIRNLNNVRIALRNTMAEKLSCPIREIKKEHLSQ